MAPPCGRTGQRPRAEQFVGYAVRPNRGTPAARIISGSCTAPGRGVSRDDAEAIRWYRRAAEQGDVLAQVQSRLGGTRTVVAWSGTAWKPSGGIGLPPSKGDTDAQKALDRLR